jgi:hypothetical protein
LREGRRLRQVPREAIELCDDDASALASLDPRDGLLQAGPVVATARLVDVADYAPGLPSKDCRRSRATADPRPSSFVRSTPRSPCRPAWARIAGADGGRARRCRRLGSHVLYVERQARLRRHTDPANGRALSPPGPRLCRGRAHEGHVQQLPARPADHGDRREHADRPRARPPGRLGRRTCRHAGRARRDAGRLLPLRQRTSRLGRSVVPARPRPPGGNDDRDHQDGLRSAGVERQRVQPGLPAAAGQRDLGYFHEGAGVDYDWQE